ncbi:uncharacterized protein Dcma isoform X1 [Anoplolepis gracilipes]|uniref:uncharacterized protein Dcma isoform X1 n=1 Tax=Anoplolepis gracilipes TaxID=354296 RepID=UPI003BA255EB
MLARAPLSWCCHMCRGQGSAVLNSGFKIVCDDDERGGRRRRERERNFSTISYPSLPSSRRTMQVTDRRHERPNATRIMVVRKVSRVVRSPRASRKLLQLTFIPAMDVGIPVDSPNLVLLFYVVQLFLRELQKSKNLIRIVPMDMSGYYESRAGPSYIGNVVSQILLCKQIRPDFNEEELCSIRKDSEEIGQLISELQEFMPQSEADTEKPVALHSTGNKINRNNGTRRMHRWSSNRDRESSYFRSGFRFLCCAASTNYV